VSWRFVQREPRDLKASNVISRARAPVKPLSHSSQHNPSQLSSPIPRSSTECNNNGTNPRIRRIPGKEAHSPTDLRRSRLRRHTTTQASARCDHSRTMGKSMMARLVRDELGKCYYREGVNHLEKCGALRGKLASTMRNKKRWRRCIIWRSDTYYGMFTMEELC